MSNLEISKELYDVISELTRASAEIGKKHYADNSEDSYLYKKKLDYVFIEKTEEIYKIIDKAILKEVYKKNKEIEKLKEELSVYEGRDIPYG